MIRKRPLSAGSLVAFTAVVILALLLGGCGGGDDSGTAGTPGQVVVDFWASMSEGDAQAAFDLMSASDQKLLPLQEMEEALSGETSGEIIDVEIVSEKINGDTAEVTASYEGTELDFELVMEDGAWKLKGIAELLGITQDSAGEGECLDNRRTISSAALQYEAGTGSYPLTIDELIPQYIKAMPVCPDDGIYSIIIGSSGPKVSCSVHGTSDY